MIEKIRNYVDKIFAEVPKTRKNWELKEELIGNLQERFRDCLSAGMSEEEAYESAIESLGNVNELLAGIQGGQENTKAENEQNRKKRAVCNTVAVGFYILAGAVFFALALVEDTFTAPIDFSSLGLVIAILICIIPICINVYTAYAFPKYTKNDDTVVEEFKEWQSGKGHNKEIKKSIKSILWMLTVILYMVISFATGAWYITWVIYLIAFCLEQVINLLFSLKE